MPPLARFPRRRPTNPRKSPCPPLRPLRRPALSPRHPRLPFSRQTLARMRSPPLRNARSFPPSRRRSPAPPIHSRRPKRLSGAASPFPPRALSLLSFPPTSPRRILRLRADLSPAGRRPLQSGSPSPFFPPIFTQLLGVSQALLQLKACILRQKRILAADLRRNASSASSASSRGSFARPGVTSGGPATYLFGPRQRRALVFPPFSANVGLTASAMKPPSSKRPPCRSPSQTVRNSRQDPFSRFPNRYRFPAVFLQILLTMSRAIVTWCARDTSLPREERVNALWRVWLAVSLTEPRKSVAEQALLEAFRLQRQHRDVLRGDGGVAFSYYASLWENRGNAT